MLDSTLNLLIFVLVTFGGPALAIWLVWSIHRIRLALENIAHEMRRSTGPRNTF
jgi:hypothetical protein